MSSLNSLSIEDVGVRWFETEKQLMEWFFIVVQKIEKIVRDIPFGSYIVDKTIEHSSALLEQAFPHGVYVIRHKDKILAVLRKSQMARILELLGACGATVHFFNRKTALGMLSGTACLAASLRLHDTLDVASLREEVKNLMKCRQKDQIQIEEKSEQLIVLNSQVEEFKKANSFLESQVKKLRAALKALADCQEGAEAFLLRIEGAADHIVDVTEGLDRAREQHRTEINTATQQLRSVSDTILRRLGDNTQE